MIRIYEIMPPDGFEPSSEAPQAPILSGSSIQAKLRGLRKSFIKDA